MTRLNTDRRPVLRSLLFVSMLLLAGLFAWLWMAARSTQHEIDGFRAAALEAARTSHASAPSAAADLAALPPPVQRYLRFAFPDLKAAIPHTLLQVEMEGQFRRPLTQDFNATTARQIASSATPALVFDATTPIMGVLWARAFDGYVNGRMEMRAKLLSAIEVVHENEFSSPELNRISLRRWLMESATYPQALLPGGHVTWEAIDDQSARAVAHLGDLHIGVIARFAPSGEMLSMEAETDGDLATPYHGSGEHVARSDYQLVQGVKVPMAFVFSRAAGGQVHPFWKGRITHLRFDAPSEVATAM